MHINTLISKCGGLITIKCFLLIKKLQVDDSSLSLTILLLCHKHFNVRQNNAVITATQRKKPCNFF